MKFCVPTNWQKDLIPKIKRDGVTDLYGKLAMDFIGGGRAGFLLPQVKRKEAKLHIQEAHRNGLKFNYLLNALCLDNREFTISGQRQLHKLLDWLTECKVDTLTVTIPYLLQLIKKQYPHFKVCTSILANVNTTERAKYWEDLGSDGIILKNDLTRDFNMLKLIRKRVRCELQLIANNGCLYHCPFYLHHSLMLSHASQSSHKLHGFMVEYNIINCRYIRLIDPVNFIRADWIRPEDLHYYEEAGIDKIKFTDRTAPTELLALIVKAYSERKYEGNLMDLLPCVAQKTIAQKPTLWLALRYLFRPFSINTFKFYKLMKDMAPLKVYIDNQKLGNFIEHFLEESCGDKTCVDCGYCKTVAEHAVTIDQDYRNDMLGRYKRVLEAFASSKMFKY